MGRSFVSLKRNFVSEKGIANAYDKMKRAEVVSASKEEYFYKKPSISEVDDIDVGTHESIIRLKNGDFIEVKKSVNINKLFEVV
jgi:hypothetical protein